MRYFRPVVLTKECMACHGDPAQSLALWGNSEGKDVTGAKMEGWKEGEVHGAFEIIMPLAPVDEAVNEQSVVIAGISGGVTLLITAIGVAIASVIGRRVGALAKAASAVSAGDTKVQVHDDARDELGALAASFNSMVHRLDSTISEVKMSSEEATAARDSAQVLQHRAEEQHSYLDGKIQDMLVGIDRFGNGDLTVELKAERNDEIGRLARGFNAAIAELRTLMNSVQIVVGETAASLVVVDKEAKEASDAARAQSVQTTEVAGAVEQMAKTLFETSRSVSAAADGAQAMADKARRGDEAVSQAVEGFGNIINSTTSTSKLISSLAGKTEQVGSIAQVIDDIANQTNLLALNAAIEAARAGEAGRGFAVVADEVRKLAERTQKATKEIAHTVGAVQSESTAAAHAMLSADEAVRSGRVLIERISDAFRDILSSANDVSRSIDQIAAASEQQSAAAEEISKNVDTIEQLINTSAQSSQRIVSSIESVDSMMTELSSHVSKFDIGMLPPAHNSRRLR